jgi:hypothetical protein
MMNESEIRKLLKGVVWDYNIDPYDLYLIALGKKEPIGLFNEERSLIRFVERLRWHELLELLGAEFLRENLTRDLIAKLYPPGIRKRYELIYSILHGETVSPSGWSAENRERLKASVLSDRRYNA